MALQYQTTSSTTTAPTTLADTRVRTNTLEVTANAEEGSVATSSVVIDDPAGDFDIVGHRNFAIKENTVPSGQSYIWAGATAERKVRRGPSGRVGVGREWEVSLVDLNSFLERRIMTGSDCNRPAETDVARLQWLLSTTEANLIGDTRYFNTVGPVAMDAVDYRGQTLKSVVDDCAQQSGKDYFLTFFEDTATVGFPWGLASFWYDFRSSTAYTSTCALSNDLSDVDSVTTFAISAEDTFLTRDPSRVYSGVYMPYDGGNAYVSRASIANAFARRDAVSPAENVKTSAKANARANRYLDDIDTEEDVITTSFQVPAAKVNLIREGMRVPITATHLPGYSSPVYTRVLNRTVKQDSELTYTISCELGGLDAVAPAGDVLVAFIGQTQTVGASAPTDFSTHTWTKAFWSGDVASASQFPGPGGACGFGVWYRAVVPGETANVLTFAASANPGSNIAWVYQVSGATIAGASTTNSNDTIGGLAASTVASPSAGASSVWLGGFILQKVAYGQVTLISTTNGTNLHDANGANVSGGTCGVTNDAIGPRAWFGYQTGTGVLTVGGTVTCSGATPDYNLFGRGKGGILLPLTGAFSVTQSAFNNVPGGGTVTVTLPVAP